ncbi:MAG: sigma-E factor negative regulatory protein [Betaproteobacteria bacterium]
MDRISAFVDGESAPADTLAVLKRLRSDEGSRKNIDTFHMIGDVMRGDPVLRGDFVERLRARLDEEPTVLAPHARWHRSAPALYAAAASIAGFAVIVGLAWTDNPLGQFAQGRGGAPQLAPSAIVEARVHPAAVANAGQVNEYLVAHQEFSPRTALQGVVPYVRSVSESHDGNRR